MANRVNNSRFIRLRAVCSLVLLAGFVLGGATVARADNYGWWPLNDGTGAVAKNLVDGGTDGDIADHDVAGLGENGSVWVNDSERGMVLGLAGSTGWVNAGFLPQMTFDNPFSWSFWTKQATGQGVNNDIIIGNRWDEFGADTSPREFIKFTPTQFEYHMNGAPAGNIPYDPPPPAIAPPEADIPSNDEWIHHAVVKQGNSLAYFRDGEVANSRTISVGMASLDPLPFGLGGQADTEHWRGYLSDVQLYESALDATGIASTMAGDLADGADLYARWILNDGDGGTATDQGPNSFDGDIIDWGLDGLADDGTVWVDDPDRGTVLGLGGNSAWVDAGEIPLMDLENDFTWAFWARQDPDQASPANAVVIGNRYDLSGADTVPREFIKFTPDRFEFHMEGAASGDLEYAPVVQPWVNHIVVKDGEDLAYYRDGEFAGEGLVGEEQLSEDPLVFAMGGQDGRETWAGFLSEVRLFDHSLSAEEIAELSSGSSSIPGDYNNNGELDEPDLNLQADEIVKGAEADLSFDLNNDGKVDFNDRKMWVEDEGLKYTYVGDANLDLEFNSGDMVQVFAGGKYETLQEATWGEGDFNGNKFFDSGDMVAAFAGGGYEKGLRTVAAAVPEPTSVLLVMTGLIGVAILRHRLRS